MKNNNNAVPQMRLRTNVVAGASVEACQRNLDYWRNALYQKCTGGQPTLYGETEMKPWQAGSV